jgi:SAM-dependent methyltransferase
MTETTQVPGPEVLDYFLGTLAANRFLPCPAEEMRFCGDGDFRAIGAEFLGHFIRTGGLHPTERVLDIGCGIGRMAVPLTQYLSPQGSYEGFDVVASGIEWCNAHVAARYPGFNFRHLDYRHGLYNPGGVSSTTSGRLPYEDASFDFICLVSVLTHLDASELAFYAGEIARLLAPGGRCFATAFLLNPPAREALLSGAGRLEFDGAAAGPELHANSKAPMAAVAFDEDFFLEKFLRHSLHRRNKDGYGHWSGRSLASFQDICVFSRDLA